MNKKQRQAQLENLASALAPPRKPAAKSALDNLLDDYDDGKPLTSAVPAIVAPVIEIDPDRKDQQISIAVPSSLAKIDKEATPLASLAIPSSLDRQTSLDSRSNQICLDDTASLDLLANLDPVAGYLQLPNMIIDKLLPLLPADEQCVYLHLYRLSHGFNKPTCLVSLPRLNIRTGISTRNLQRILARLERKKIIQKEGTINGRDKAQGSIFRVATPTSLDNRASLVTSSSLAKQSGIKEDLKNKINKKDLAKFIEQFRQLKGRGYPISELAEDCKQACAGAGKEWDATAFEELTRR